MSEPDRSDNDEENQSAAAGLSDSSSQSTEENQPTALQEVEDKSE